jgi:PAS domain S-box-containing protein
MGNFPAYVALAVSLFLTFFGWRVISQGVQTANNAAFKSRTGNFLMLIHERLDNHESALKDIVSMMSIMGVLSHDEWDSFTQNFVLPQARPGLLAAGFAKRVKNPDGTDSFPVVYTTSFVKKGYFDEGDNLADPPWSRELIEKTLSDWFLNFSEMMKVTSLDGREAWGYHLYIPVTKGWIKSPFSLDWNRINLLGFVTGFIAVDGLFKGTAHIGALAMPGMGVEMYDGSAPDPARLLGRYGVNPADQPSKPAFEHAVLDEFGGRKILLRFISTPSYEPERNVYEPAMALAGGVLFSFLFFGMAYTLTNARFRARRLAEEMTTAFRESEEKYRQLFSKGIDSIFIFDIESQRLLDVNSAFLRLYGYTMDEALGLSVTDICFDHEVSCEVISRVLERGEAFFPLRHHKKKNAAVFQVELAAATFTWKGRRVMFALARDITERLKAEEALRESEERFKTLTEVAEEGIGISENGVLMDVNPTLTRMFGYEPAEMLGRKILDFVDDTSREYVLSLLARNWDKPYEAMMVRKNGSRFPVEVIGKYGVYRGKRVRTASVRDITERKKWEEELYRAKEKAEMSTQLKDKFVSLVAHDLRSPFTSILGMLALLEMETDPPLHPTHREIVRRVHEMGGNLVTMIENLLSISRLKTGKMTPLKRFLNGNALVAKVTAGLSHLASEKGVSIVNDVPQGYRIYADPDLLQEAVRYLLSNAIKFSRKGDVVTVFVPEGDKAAMAVRDTGVGIRQDLIPRLFRHEEKTSTVGTSGELGTGLGLPLTGDIITAHGGSVKVESEMGKGSLFTITLPFAKPLILIVDDEPEMRLLLRMRMEALDVEIVEADGVGSAMAVVRSREVNLVITDVFMPVRDGFDLLSSIKSVKGSNLPVMVMTSDSRMETREKAFRLGADDFVTKPFTTADIIPRARRLLLGLF